MDSFYQLALVRESCRHYQDKAVERELLVKCLEAARLAPSGCNSQPWHFVAVREKEAVKKVAKAVQRSGANRFAEQIPAFIVITEDPHPQLIPRIEAEFGCKKFAHGDIGLTTAYLTLQASDLGLSTCILGTFYEEQIKEALAIPDDQIVRLVIAIGYTADEKPRQKTRKPLEEMVRFVE